MKNYLFIFVIGLALASACDNTRQIGQDQTQGNKEEINPPAPGFNLEQSDAKAIEIADQVMQAMGGRHAWEATRCIQWNFFGARELIWDKHAGMVRVNYANEDRQAIVNIHTKEGAIWKEGAMVSDPDTLDKYLDQAYRAWINDSYWLVMPYKLKDTGVTLKYLGEDTTQTGDEAWKLQLTFEEVGVTPQNKYHIWVDQDRKLVTQWAFFREYTLDEPNFITPWDNYQQYGDILLSGDRGEREITDIAVHENIPEGAFTLEKP